MLYGFSFLYILRLFFQISPVYSDIDASTVAAYLTSSVENIDYYWTTGNVKQVAMNTEVASSSVTDLVSCIKIAMGKNTKIKSRQIVKADKVKKN